MRKCLKHNEEKIPQGTQGQFKCRSCNRENQAKWYSANKAVQTQRSRETAKTSTERNRSFVYDYLLQHHCVDCKESDPIVLEFDHLSDKEFAVSKMIHRPSSLEAIIREIGKCEVRCANCHKRKTAKDFGWWKANQK